MVKDVTFCQFCTEFCSNSCDCKARLGTIMTEHPSEMQLYIILAILDNFESDTFNKEITSSQAKPVQCFPAMVGFSSDKINILQHIKHLFNVIRLMPRVLDGMNVVNPWKKTSFSFTGAIAHSFILIITHAIKGL